MEPQQQYAAAPFETDVNHLVQSARAEVDPDGEPRLVEVSCLDDSLPDIQEAGSPRAGVCSTVGKIEVSAIQSLFDPSKKQQQQQQQPAAAAAPKAESQEDPHAREIQPRASNNDTPQMLRLIYEALRGPVKLEAHFGEKRTSALRSMYVMAKFFSGCSEHASSVADVRKFSFQSLRDRGLTEAEANNFVMRLRALHLGMLLDGPAPAKTTKEKGLDQNNKGGDHKKQGDQNDSEIAKKEKQKKPKSRINKKDLKKYVWDKNLPLAGMDAAAHDGDERAQ